MSLLAKRKPETEKTSLRRVHTVSAVLVREYPREKKDDEEMLYLFLNFLAKIKHSNFKLSLLGK